MKNKKLFWIIGIISVVAALSAAFTAFFIVKDKQKKDDEELMECLDSAREKITRPTIRRASFFQAGFAGG